MKEKILRLIELKVELIKLKDEHEKECEELEKDGGNPWFFAEGGESNITRRIWEIEEEIEKIQI